MAPTASEHGDDAVTAPPLHRLPRRPRGRLHARLQAAKRFCCRLEVCWTAAFAVILVGLAVAVTATTQVQVTRSLISTWHATHHARIAYNTRRLSIGTERVHDIANGFMSLNRPDSNTGRAYTPPSLICSILDNYDKKTRFRALLFISIERDVGIGCMHGIESTGSLRTLTGLVSEDAIINGSYLVDNTTYRFVEPRRMMSEWPASARNLSLTVRPAYVDLPVFTLLPAYLNGSIDRVDPRLHWMLLTQMPHLILYSLPVGYLARGLDTLGDMNYTDFTQVRLDGSRLLIQYEYVWPAGFSALALINQSLGDADPLVLSNNWGQPSVSNDDIYAILSETVTYLRVSEISDPLMRAGLKHVDVAQLQREGSNQTVDFEYAGAVATVTAYSFTTDRGLVVPLVFVGSHAAITGPYLRYFRIFDAVLAAVVVLCTAAFWYCARHFISQPLRRMTALLLASADAGQRALLYRPTNAVLQLAEVQALGQVIDAAVRRVREIAEFVPAAQRRRSLTLSVSAADTAAAPPTAATTPSISTGTRAGARRDLLSHPSTAVYISITRACPPSARPPRAPPLQATPIPAPHDEGEVVVRRRGPRLVTVVERAAQQIGAVNSGPFPSAAALAAFVEVTHELCRRHHGTAHRVCPDGCVLHFNRAVRRVLPTCTPDEAAAAAVAPAAPAAARTRHGVPAAQSRPPPAPTPMQRAAAQDARDAAAFALALTRWADSRGGAGGAGGAAGGGGDGAMPDVRVLLDTALFACGPYRPLGSEQTLQVALGRDVQRDAGGVPRRIGVRVAMTEETAVRVRDAASGGGAAGAEADADADADAVEHAEGRAGSDGAGGVRAIPVEALRTGRAGLDAQSLVLYEALPGRVAGDAAWQAYARCCDDGFALMVRGDYAGARRAYGGVADIADLEPGLLPPSLSREAARSDVRGGAVSTQVARLVRECEARVECKTEAPLCKVRKCPFGIDTVLGVGAAESLAATTLAAMMERSDCDTPAARTRSRWRKGSSSVSKSRGSELQRYAPVKYRSVIVFTHAAQEFRCVLPIDPAWFTDNDGQRWYPALYRHPMTPEAMWSCKLTALSSTGVLASSTLLLYREVHPLVSKRIREAPAGPMSDKLRSAVPVCGPTKEQDSVVRRLVAGYRALHHPNLLPLLGFSQSIEGGVVLLYPYSPGGTLRDVLDRYREVAPVTFVTFALQILSALAYLHGQGVVHGNVCMDNVLLGADGVCQLAGYSVDHAASHRVMIVPQGCCISPHMATGALPTRECDIFCYGLMALEFFTKKPPWRWATREDGQPLGTAQELQALMKAAGPPFREAVLTGRVVPHKELLETQLFTAQHPPEGVAVRQACVAFEPSLRPTAVEIRDAAKWFLVNAGVKLEEGTCSVTAHPGSHRPQ